MKRTIKSRTILFLSAIDFKEKSIQVIRKTPEAYVNKNWNVFYIVARDNAKKGNYSYENEIKPEGINIIRFYYPLTAWYDKINNHTLQTVISKIRGYYVIIRLALMAIKVLKNHKIDVIYGYETHGVLAVNLLRLFRKLNRVKIVSRFQGTLCSEIIRAKKYFKGVLVWDSFLALYLSSDLCIMTNDGTRGDKALMALKSGNLKNLKFWQNGVDMLEIPEMEKQEFRKKLNIKKKHVFLSLCRLESWKRVDRIINMIDLLVHKYCFNDFHLFIIGEGPEHEKLVKLAEKKNLLSHISFKGAIKHEEIKYYLNIADMFFSTYDFSNVGNPLLEAIKANKIIFTLNNGDTNQWIYHKENGFIYEINNNLLDVMANDVFELVNNEDIKEKIVLNIRQTANSKLWTWDERFTEEIASVENLFV